MPAREAKDKVNLRRDVYPTPKRGVYPGSFNPPTTGHLLIIEAAMGAHDLDRLDLVVSSRAINKENVERPTLAHRVEVLAESVSHLDGVHVRVTDLRLIADIAWGYDVVVMGADKWAQVNNASFYDNSKARDDALARLPVLAIAPRGDDAVPAHALLDIGQRLDQISSSAARAGDRSLMTAAALSFDERSGAWTDPARYDRFIHRSPPD